MGMYYKINPLSSEKGVLIGCANGCNIISAESYFIQMNNGALLENLPVLDCFFLESYEKKNYWDAYLMDIHRGIGVFPIGNWLISDRLEELLAQFAIAQEYRFYESYLLHKGQKHKYWLFQFASLYRKLNKTNYINFKKSLFLNRLSGLEIHSYDDYLITEMNLREKKEKIIAKRIVLNDNVDFIHLSPINTDVIVSEMLMLTIKEASITGFEFSEIDYEVVIDEK